MSESNKNAFKLNAPEGGVLNSQQKVEYSYDTGKLFNNQFYYCDGNNLATEEDKKSQCLTYGWE